MHEVLEPNKLSAYTVLGVSYVVKYLFYYFIGTILNVQFGRGDLEEIASSKGIKTDENDINYNFL